MTDLYDPPPPFAHTSETSRLAAESVVGITERQRRDVLFFVREQAHNGATRDQVQVGLGIAGDSVRPRVLELIARGLLRETKLTRPTRAGRQAAVLVAVEHYVEGMG